MYHKKKNYFSTKTNDLKIQNNSNYLNRTQNSVLKHSKTHLNQNNFQPTKQHNTIKHK